MNKTNYWVVELTTQKEIAAVFDNKEDAEVFAAAMNYQMQDSLYCEVQEDHRK